MCAVFRTNCAGTVSVTQAVLPSMRGAELRTIVSISSQLGSIQNTFGGAQGRLGGVACYRIARAANNMALRTFAAELSAEGFTCVSLSPGHVATDMGSAGGRAAPLTVEESVGAMIKVVAGLAPEQNGQFFDFDGKQLPW